MRDIVLDCHIDTLYKKFLFNYLLFMPAKEVNLHVTKEMITNSPVNTLVYAIFVPPKLEKIALDISLEMLNMAKEMIKEDADYHLIQSNSDFRVIQSNKEKIGVILSIEGAVTFERNLPLLELFFDLGVRNLGLVWSRKNLFAEGVMRQVERNEGDGLSVYGKDMLAMMNELGMVVDVSHLNQAGFDDVFKLSESPFIASHSNADTVCSHKRNLTDDQLEAIQSVDGVVGVNFCPSFLNENAESASLEDVMKHLSYMVDLIGIDHVGIGSDFDGIFSTPQGLENISKIQNLKQELKTNGFSKQDIKKILGTNFQRVFSKIWK